MKFASHICALFLFILMSTPIIAQDISEILSIQEIDTILYSGPKDNRINSQIQRHLLP